MKTNALPYPLQSISDHAKARHWHFHVALPNGTPGEAVIPYGLLNSVFRSDFGQVWLLTLLSKATALDAARPTP